MKIIQQKNNLRVVEMNGVYYYQQYFPKRKDQAPAWVTMFEASYKPTTGAQMRVAI